MESFRLKRPKLNKSIITIAVCLAVMLVFLLAFNITGNSSLKGEESSLKSAIARDVTHCYAEHGYYPPSLDYIKEHYGLIYDEDTFLVDYRPIGNNIYPDVNVVRLGGGSDGD